VLGRDAIYSAKLFQEQTMRNLPSGPVIELEAAGRLEAFSDGVFAIAITLLVLDLHVPAPVPGVTLAQQLLAQLPVYIAFLTSFATIGIIWINHHRFLAGLSHADHWLLVLNGLMLLGVTFIPFPTALFADYINTPDATTAALVYTGTFVFIAIAFNVIYIYAADIGRLLSPDTAEDIPRTTKIVYGTSFVLYLVAFVASYFNALAGFGIVLALAIFYALPPRLMFIRGE
jgi:uncharacterized membrane protein